MQGPEGLLFAGKYKIVKLIGRGGMANVYLGVDINTNLKVAIKVMRPEFATDEEFIRRFDTEARAVSSLNHSNIVKVFGVGHEGNYRYIVQEYVEGITVKELINQNGHLDWRVAVPIVIQVGMALEYAHKNGVIHRDIKPQNILISRDRIAKITDFGIARASTGNTITMSSGGALGSVHYFSPEQARGGNVGPQSDIYSIGVMLFEMVTGRVPFDGDSNVAIAVKHLQEKAPYASTFAPDIPQGLDSIIQKCMQKVPERRYTTMRQMVTELDALMTDPNGVYGVINANSNPYDESTEDDVKLNFRQDPNYDKISDLEKSAEARRRSRFRDNVVLVLIIVVIVGVLIGLSVLIINSLSNATTIEQSTDYVVRNYVGLTVEEVTTELQKNQIDYSIDYEERDDVDPGIIVAQTPAEDSVIKINSSRTTVSLVVSRSPDGPVTSVLADYTNQDYRIVSATLTSQHYAVSVVSEENSEIDPGCVIRTDPPAGSEIEAESPIIIYYVPSSATVPDIRNMNQDEVDELFRDTRFNVTYEVVTEEAEDLPTNQRFVITTDPPIGTDVAPNSAIRVYFGTYEDAQRGTTPTPTPIPMTVTVTITGGAGEVEGEDDYLPGDTVELVAIPGEGFIFDCWYDSLGNQVSVTETYRFVVQDNVNPNFYTFTAVFAPEPTATPVPTNTPIPTPTPVPTDTPTPVPTEAPTETETVPQETAPQDTQPVAPDPNQTQPGGEPVQEG